MGESDQVDAEATITYHGDLKGVRAQVTVTRREEIESVVLGQGRPRTFEERYPFAGRIGEGGMGDVHLARDRVLGREVAVKVLREGRRPEPLVLQRFLREAQITAQLAHPNVIPCYGLESTGENAPAFVMKLIEGATFKEYVAECLEVKGTGDWDHDRHGLKARVEHFVKVCDAVAYSHQRGVIHRDLKPANLMLGDHNVVYVMDWGIARVIGEVEEAGLFPGGEPLDEGAPDTRTQTGDLVGTPLYMSPEQINLDSDQLTPASDQYSLGLVLFNLVTGRAPRTGGGVIEVLQQAGRGERAEFPTEGMGRAAPKELRAIVDRACAKNPANRYASASELVADLRRFLHGDPVMACPDNLLRALWRRIQKHPVKVLSALLVFVLVAASATTWSLVKKVEAEKRREFEASATADVVQWVGEIDVTLTRTDSLVRGLATDIKWILKSEPVAGEPWPGTEDFSGPNAPADLAPLPRYQGPVSFERSVGVLAPGVTREEVREVARHSRRLELELGRTLLATLEAGQAPDHSIEYPREPALERLRHGIEVEVDGWLRTRFPMQYAFVGFEVGWHLALPGSARHPEGFDPRKRPWYRRGLEASGAIWGAPYWDASGSGFLLPCIMAIRDEDGALVGVAGMDAALGRAVRSLGERLDQEKGWLRGYLVDVRGEILLDTEDSGGEREADLHGNRERPRRPLPVPGVVEKIKTGIPTGIVEDEDENELYVFVRMQTIDWIMVVQIDLDEALD